MIASILTGETELYHELIRPHERGVYRMALSLMKNEADAEDVAQEAVLKGFRNLKNFRAQAKFSTWLISITLNEARGRLRHAKVLRMESLDVAPDESGHVSPALLRDWREVPSEALERKEVREMLRTAIGHLSTIYREVLLLRDVEEMSIDETAATLRITPGTVKVRLHRARLMLQKELAPRLKHIHPNLKRRWLPWSLECKHVWEFISGYLDDSLPPETRALVQRHLEHCEICSAILDSTRNILVLTGDDRVFELPVGFSERLHARLADEMAAIRGEA